MSIGFSYDAGSFSSSDSDVSLVQLSFSELKDGFVLVSVFGGTEIGFAADFVVAFDVVS